MKKIYVFYALLITSTIGKSQITITNASMPSSADTIRYSIASNSSVGNYTATGTNYNWNFSTLNVIGQNLREFKPSFLTPYAFFFLPPKFGEKTQDTIPIPAIPGVPALSITDVYSFYKKTTSFFAVEGIGIKLNGIPVPNFNTNEDELYLFPLNYTDRDSTTFTFSTVSSTLVPFQYKKNGYRITQADGWGSITTPYGTANCLRVVSTQYSIDTISTTLLPSPFNKLGFPNNVRSYQWLTLGEKIPYLEVVGNLIGSNFTITQVKYRDIKRSSNVGLSETEQNLLISAFPNPATHELNLILPQTKTTVSLTITDLQGKMVLSREVENTTYSVNKHVINTSKLAPGLYLLNLSTATQNQSIKISIQ